MREIVRVPFPLSGTNDTVEMMTDCGFARFENGMDGLVRMKKEPEKYQCKLSASMERGLVSIFVSEKNVLVSVRMVDARKIIKAADEVREPKI